MGLACDTQSTLQRLVEDDHSHDTHDARSTIVGGGASDDWQKLRLGSNCDSPQPPTLMLPSSNRVIFSWRRRPLDFSFLFLTWLCLSLICCSPAPVYARDMAPEGLGVNDLHIYNSGIKCSTQGGQCCEDDSIACQGWFCYRYQCSIFPCDFCRGEGDDPEWFCGPIQGADDPRDGGMGCKRKAFFGQICSNQTMPCQAGMMCGANSTCEYLPETQHQMDEQFSARRMTMVGMLVVLLVMFFAMRRMLKNEEARRRQIWEPVDSSAEASILRRLAEDTQRRLAGGWDQLNGSIVAGSNAASHAVGSALTRIRQGANGGSANTHGRRGAADDCDDVEMQPSRGERAQTRRELEEDMRAFMLEADDDDDEDLWGDDDDDEGRDQDGLLARNRRPGSSSSGSSSSSSSASGHQHIHHGVRNNGDQTTQAEGYSDEPPAYDAVLGGEERRSMSSTLLGTAPVGSSRATTTTTLTPSGEPIEGSPSNQQP